MLIHLLNSIKTKKNNFLECQLCQYFFLFIVSKGEATLTVYDFTKETEG